MKLDTKNKHTILIVSLTIGVLTIIFVQIYIHYSGVSRFIHPAPNDPETVTTVPTSSPAESNKQPQTPAPSSDVSNYGIVVNKKHPMSPISYTPTDLESIGSQTMLSVPADAIRRMQTDSEPNIPIVPASGYRSYQAQNTIYNSYVAKDGQAMADTYRARPGYSERQTGLAMDFSPIDQAFADTPQFVWLSQNAYKYGFVLRYPDSKTDITGYMHEPWHWRYVGVTAATDMHSRGITTLEEYFNVPGGDY